MTSHDSCLRSSPAQGSVSCSGYGWRSNDGVLTAFGRVTPATITDGLSSTMIVGEWSDWITDTNGSKLDLRPDVGFADGSAQFLADAMAIDVLSALACRADGISGLASGW